MALEDVFEDVFEKSFEIVPPDDFAFKLSLQIAANRELE